MSTLITNLSPFIDSGVINTLPNPVFSNGLGIIVPLNLTPGVPNINGFVFDVEGSVKHDAVSDITDHYVENNTPVQDHIALKPLKITLKNYQGEIITSGTASLPSMENTNIKLWTNNFVKPIIPPSGNQNIFQKIVAGYSQKVNGISNVFSLTAITSTISQYSSLMTQSEVAGIGQLQNKISSVQNVQTNIINGFNNLSNAYGLVENYLNKFSSAKGTNASSGLVSPPSANTSVGGYIPLDNSTLFKSATNRQSQAYQYFENLWRTKTLVSVLTAFNSYTNFAIESIVSIQEEDSRNISSFQIVLKEIRYASTQLVSINTQEINTKYGLNPSTTKVQSTPIKQPQKVYGSNLGFNSDSTIIVPIPTVGSKSLSANNVVGQLIMNNLPGLGGS